MASPAALDSNQKIGDEKYRDGYPVVCAREESRCAIERRCEWRLLEPQKQAREYRGRRPATSASLSIHRIVIASVRPDFIGIRLERIDVHHPVEYQRKPPAARFLAGGLRGNGTFRSEFLPIDIPHRRALRRQADIHVLVPARHAERNARFN